MHSLSEGVARFLQGRRPTTRANGVSEPGLDPSETLRIVDGAMTPVVDPWRAEAVRRVARTYEVSLSAPLTYARREQDLEGRADADLAPFWEALVSEGLLPAQWSDPSSVRFCSMFNESDPRNTSDPRRDPSRPPGNAAEAAALAALLPQASTAEALVGEFCRVARTYGEDVGNRVLWRLHPDTVSFDWNTWADERIFQVANEAVIRALPLLKSEAPLSRWRAVSPELYWSRITQNPMPRTMFARHALSLLWCQDLVLRAMAHPSWQGEDLLRPIVSLWELGVGPMNVGPAGVVIALPALDPQT